MATRCIKVQLPSKDLTKTHEVLCAFSDYTKTYIGATERDRDLMLDYGSVHFMPVVTNDDPLEHSREWVQWAGAAFKIIYHYSEEFPV